MAAPAPGNPDKPPMSNRKKASIAVGVFFGAVFVIGGIGSAIDKRKKEAAARCAEAAPPTAMASTSQPPVPASVSPTTQPTGPASLAMLAQQVETARAKLQAEKEEHGSFQIHGKKITERTTDMLLVWGKALPTNGTPINQMGCIFEEGNVIVKDYDKQDISAVGYFGFVYYLEQKHGKGNFGQSVPVLVYTGKEPASLAKARTAFEQATAAYEKAKGGAP